MLHNQSKATKGSHHKKNGKNLGLVNLKVSWKNFTLRICRIIPRFGCLKDFSCSLVISLRSRLFTWKHHTLRMLDIKDVRIFEVSSRCGQFLEIMTPPGCWILRIYGYLSSCQESENSENITPSGCWILRI